MHDDDWEVDRTSRRCCATQLANLYDSTVDQHGHDGPEKCQ